MDSKPLAGRNLQYFLKNILPKELASINRRNRYLNEEREATRRTVVSRGRGARMKQRSAGTIIEVRPGDPSGRPPASSWFRGDWDPNASYVESEGVAIRGGITAGLYICHTDAAAGTPPPSPADYSHWTLVVSGNAMGLWM